MTLIATNTTRLLSRLSVGAFVLLLSAPLAGAWQASSTYKGAGRDPFSTHKPKVTKKAEVRRQVINQIPVQVQPPAIQERVKQYKMQKEMAMAGQAAAPRPTSALLLSEIEVTGIARTPRGYGAWVAAKPFTLTLIIYPGEQFWDGQLVGVEENRLVFRRDIRWTNNKVTSAVEMKQVRPPTNVSDPTMNRSGSGK